MGITLTSKTVSSTYDALLKLSDNDQLTGAFKLITDGLGNDSGISINNSGDVNISGILVVGERVNTPILQLTGGSGTQGTMSWNDNEETVDLVQNGTTTPLNQATELHVKNQTGATIAKGTPVRAAGTLGASGRILIAPMIANGTIEAKYFLGVTNEAIANGQDGKVITFGKIRSINTAAYTEGQTLWVSATTAGAFTTTRPVAPNLDLEVAIVINSHHNNGTIFVRATNGHYLGTAHDVNISSVAENDLLVYKTNRWVNTKTIGDLTAANVTLSGYLRGPATFVIDPAAYGDETGLVQILGDLRVDGTTTTINSTTISVSDKNITLAKDAATAGDANGAGITIAGASATLTYLSATDDFTFNKNVNASRFVGPLTGDVTGNADTADALSAARNIALDGSVTGNADFDGSGNITITTTTNHNHDDRYYTETESDARYLPIAGKAANSELLDGIDSTGFVKQLGNTNDADYTTPSSRRLNPSATGPNNFDYFALSTFGNDNNVTGQLATQYVNGQLYSRGFNTTWSSWKRYWSDSDFTSTNVSNWNTAYSYSQIGHLPLTGGTLTGDLTLDDKLTITGTTNNFVIDEEADGTWHLYDTFQENGIVLYSGSGGMDFQYMGVTEMTIDGSGVSFTGTINLDAADLNIGSADIIFGTTAGGATRGLIWDVSGSGFLSKLIGGGADGGKVTLFANMDDAITTGNIFEIKDGSTGSLFLGLSHAGILTAGGGTSTQWNTAYTYSQVGHLPLAGGTLTGALSVKGNILLTGDATTTNQDRMIDFTGFDKEGVTDFTDRAYIQHTVNAGGHAGSVLVLSSQNDADDGIAFLTNASSQLKHNGNNIITSATIGSQSVAFATNAGTLDSIDSSQFLRSDESDTMTGSLTINASGVGLNVSSTQNTGLIVDGGTNSGIISEFKYGTTKAIINTSGGGYFLGSVSIGRTSPQSKLHVVGGGDTFQFAMKLAKSSYDDVGGHTTLIGIGCEDSGWSRSAIGHTRTASFDAGYLGFYVSNNTSNGNDLVASDLRMMINRDGNVGINTTSPFRKFQVDGGAGVRNGSFWIGDESGSTNDGIEFYKSSNILRIYKNAGSFGGTYTGEAVNLDLFSGIAYSTRISGGGNSYFAGGGNVGIGTTSPSTNLHVNGSGSRLIRVTTSGALSSGFYDIVQILAANQTGGGLSLNIGKAESTKNLGKMAYVHTSDGSNSNRLAFGFYDADNLLNLTAGGNVGIGLTNPGYKLQVSGVANANDIVINNTTTGVNLRFQMNDGNGGIFTTGDKPLYLGTNNTSNHLVITSAGNVGIGTTSPARKLEVRSDVNGDVVLARFSNRNGNASTGAYIGFATGYDAEATIGAKREGAENDSSLIFSPMLNQVATERMRITSAGNVGIGKTNPSQKLEVVGIVKSSGASNSLMFENRTNASNTWEWYSQGVTGSGFAGLYKNHNTSDTPLVVTDTGRVGIGTTSPEARLHIVYGAGESGFLSRGASGDTWFPFSNGQNYVRGITYFDSGNTYFTGGKVGIGTDSPTHTLTIKTKTTLGQGGNLRINRGADRSTHQNYIVLESDIYSDEIYIGTPVNSSDAYFGARWGNMYFTTGAYETRMTINTAGSVGIGSTSLYHSAKLSIAGKVHFQASSNTDIGGAIYSTWTQGANSSDYYAGDLRFQNFDASGGTYALVDRMIIDGRGYVGIGTNSPYSKLTVSGTQVEAHINNGDTNTLVLGGFSSGRHFIKSINLGVALTPLTLQASSFTFDTGNVGIGVTTPDTKLHVVGTDGSGARTSPLNVLTITGENGNSPYNGFGGAILFTNRIYDGGPSPGGIREGARIRTSINTNSSVNYGTDLLFENTATGDGSLQTRMILRYNGNVGIGTADPTSELEVNGNIGFTGDSNRYLFLPDVNQGTGSIYIQAGFGSALAGGAVKVYGHNATTYTGGDVEIGLSGKGDFMVNRYIGGSRLFTVRDSGNCGIGVTNPSYKLDVAGTTRVSMSMTESGWISTWDNTATNGHQMYFGYGNATGTRYGLYVTGGTGNSGFDLAVANKFYVNGTGQVFIGSGGISPLNQFAVVKSNTYGYYNRTEALAVFQGVLPTLLVAHDGNNTNEYAEIKLGNNQSTYYPYSAYIRGVQGGGINYYKLEFGTSNNAAATTRMVVAFDGKVGIGTTDPTHQLHIATDNDNTYALRVQGATNNGAGVWTGIGLAGEGANTKAAIIFEDIGSSYSRGKLHFAINNELNQNSATPANARLTITNDGYVGINDTTPSYMLDVNGAIRATGDVYAYSDARVKENVETIDNALDKVMSLRGVSYNRTDDDDKTKKVGVIAQEIQKVLPEVVSEQEDGMLSVSYGNIVGVLIEAIKEQQKQIDELKELLNVSTK